MRDGVRRGFGFGRVTDAILGANFNWAINWAINESFIVPSLGLSQYCWEIVKCIEHTTREHQY